MTKAQALAEARRRWGAIGHVELAKTVSGRKYCYVGTVYGIAGSGYTWTDAFADAKQRIKRKEGGKAWKPSRAD